MEKHEDYKPRIFKGAGILTGFAIGSVAGILVVTITGIIGLIGAVGASVALPAGLYLENKFQREKAEQKAKSQKIYLLLVLLGVALFFTCFFLVK